MLKKWSKAALCAVTTLMVAAFALTVFVACSNGSDEDGKKDLPTTTVAALPTSVGTDPFTTGTYTAGTTYYSDYWDIGLCEGKDQGVSGTKFEIDTAKHLVKFLYNDSKHDGKETTDALMKYAYDDTKKEIYLALSKLGYEKKGDDDTRYLWTRDEIVSYLRSIVGQTFYEKGEPYVYTQEKFEKKKKEIVDMFEVAVTYGYEKSDDGIITLNLKEPIIEGYDTSVTLTPSVEKLL